MKEASLKKIFAFALGASLLSVIARIILTLTQLDSYYGVYDHGAIAPTIYHVLLFLACIGGIVLGFVGAKDYPRPGTPRFNRLSLFAGYVGAFLIAALTALTIYNVISMGYSPSALMILEVVFAVPSVIWLFTMSDEPKMPTLSTFCSLFPIGWISLQMIAVYFDVSTLNTSPNKTIHELAMLAFMAYFLNEPRFLLGKSSGRLFIASSSVAMILLSTSALPNLILPGYLMIGSEDNYLIYSIELALAIFIGARLFAFVKSPTNLEPEEAPEEAERTEE